MRIVKEEPEKITASEIMGYGKYVEDLSSLKFLADSFGYVVNVADDEEEATGVLIYIPAMTVALLMGDAD